MRRIFTSTGPFLVVAGVGIVAFWLTLDVGAVVRHVFERGHAFTGSAETAYGYGNRHFDAIDPAAYDIDAAEYYFELARKKDPMLPHVHHQLARIAFLRGDFPRAMTLINTELDGNPSPPPSSYYIRALIAGFAGLYDLSIRDYQKFLQHDPYNWAAVNDYTWVLLKAGRVREAQAVTRQAVELLPINPWILNSAAIAHRENGQHEDARDYARLAAAVSLAISKEDWLRAYPGNDPRIAEEGIWALQDAIRSNFRNLMIEEESETLTFQ